MARALNGLHWQSPTTTDCPGSRHQVNGAGSGVGFGSVLILSHAGVPPAGEDEAKHNIYWLEYSMACRPAGIPFHEATVVRLYYPSANNVPSASDLAGLWGNLIRWCQGQGVYNFQVLNELDIEHNNTATPQFMADVASYILNRERVPGVPIWLGFPGPSAASGMYPPDSVKWIKYWNDYASAINQHYSWIAPHAYPARIPLLPGLKQHARLQAQDVRLRFPNRPQRFTEYGIPIEQYAGQCGNRGPDYAAFVNYLRAPSDWSPQPDYILAAHAFLARDSPYFSSDCASCYALQDGEVQSLAVGVGCVGQ